MVHWVACDRGEYLDHSVTSLPTQRTGEKDTVQQLGCHEYATIGEREGGHNRP